MKTKGIHVGMGLVMALIIFLVGSPSASDTPKEILRQPQGSLRSKGKTGIEKVRVTDQGEHVILFIGKKFTSPRVRNVNACN